MGFPVAELLLEAYGDENTGDPRATTGTRRGARVPSSDADDAELVARLRAGDGDAYERAIRAYYGWLRRVALSFVASEVAAEEIVDGAFARMWEAHATLAPTTRLAVFLFVSVRHAALNHLKHEAAARRRLRLSELPDTGRPPGMSVQPLAPDLAAEQEDVVATVWRAIESLPPRTRRILELRWREQRDWPAIAEAVGTTPAAVQMQHSRALKVLRERLAGYLAGE